jgi:hypothetical protein
MSLDLAGLGWLVKREKCVGLDAPLEVFKAVGFLVNLKLQVFQCPDSKLVRLVECAQMLLELDSSSSDRVPDRLTVSHHSRG